MTSSQFTEFFHDVIISMHENIRDLEGKKIYAFPEEQDYLNGRLFSYREVIEIMKDSAKSFDIDQKELGI
ncbi:hypothetical protein [Runella sp.]|uniref:hypothetical protein n=1 Tax=Runella sp. TaxID=1960881 RepID=UPI003D13FEF0